MTQISRLKASEISNGNLINADDINTELNQLVSNDNSQDTRITNLESGDVTLTGVKSFDTTPLTDSINEKTDNTGVTVDGVLLKDGFINLAITGAQISSVDTGTDVITTASAHHLTSGQSIQFITTGTLPSGLSTATVYYVSVESSTTFTVYSDTLLTTLINITSSGSGSHEISSDPASLNDGDLWYNTADNVLKVQLNGATATISTSSLGWPKGYIHGNRLQYFSNSQVVIPSGLQCRDDSNAINIDVTSDITIDITTTTGPAITNALMNGLTEANNQWYYVWVIAKAGGLNPAGLLTTSSSSIATFPADYLYKRLIGAVRNNGSGHFIPFTQTGNKVIFDVENSYWSGATEVTGSNNVVNAGTSTSFTSVDCSAFIPNIAELGVFTYHGSTANNYVQIRKSTASHTGIQVSGSTSSIVTIETLSQTIEYKRQAGSGSAYIDVIGYHLTELN